MSKFNYHFQIRQTVHLPGQAGFFHAYFSSLALYPLLIFKSGWRKSLYICKERLRRALEVNFRSLAQLEIIDNMKSDTAEFRSQKSGVRSQKPGVKKAFYLVCRPKHCTSRSLQSAVIPSDSTE